MEIHFDFSGTSFPWTSMSVAGWNAERQPSQKQVLMNTG